MQENMTKRVTFSVALLSASLFLGFFTLQSIMWAVWGAPVHLLQYVALLGCLGLLLSGILWAVAEKVGRVVAVISLIAIGTIYVPASISLVPAHNIIISPLAWALIITYFLTLALVLLLPPRRFWDIALFSASVVTSFGFAGVTYYSRWKDGEFCRPSFAYYRMNRNGTSLFFEGSGSEWLSSEVLKQVKDSGIQGSLNWTGSTGDSSNNFKVIVICAGKPASVKKLFYPQQGTIVYYFDGSAWRTIPEQPKTYESFATLDTEGNQSVLHQKLATGGVQGTQAFSW
jgi:hypothetical protein